MVEHPARTAQTTFNFGDARPAERRAARSSAYNESAPGRQERSQHDAASRQRLPDMFSLRAENQQRRVRSLAREQKSSFPLLELSTEQTGKNSGQNALLRYL